MGPNSSMGNVSVKKYISFKVHWQTLINGKGIMGGLYFKPKSVAGFYRYSLLIMVIALSGMQFGLKSNA